jgi:hypothetical protein
MLNVIDEFTLECLAIRVARKLKAIDVIGVLSDLFSFNARLRDELLNGEFFYTLREAACLARLQATSTRGVPARLRHVAGCATPTGSAGHAGATANLKLTFHLDHSPGADQSCLQAFGLALTCEKPSSGHSERVSAMLAEDEYGSAMSLHLSLSAGSPRS